MNAFEARELTKNSMETVVIEKYIRHIDARIAKQANAGKSSIHNPNSGNVDQGLDFYLTTEETKAVRMYYENFGFKWTEHADPDPGHPCGGAYTTLTW